MVQLYYAMKYKSIFVLLLVIPLIYSCATQNDEPNFVRSFSPVTEIAFSEISSQRDIIVATHLGSAGCAEFDNYVVMRDGFTINIEVFQKREQGLVCSTEVIEIQTPIRIRFPEVGEYTLNFRRFGPDDFTSGKITIDKPSNPSY